MLLVCADSAASCDHVKAKRTGRHEDEEEEDEYAVACVSAVYTGIPNEFRNTCANLRKAAQIKPRENCSKPKEAYRDCLCTQLSPSSHFHVRALVNTSSRSLAAFATVCSCFIHTYFFGVSFRCSRSFCSLIALCFMRCSAAHIDSINIETINNVNVAEDVSTKE